ncbi:MAG TPA: hypothetical protein VKF15_03890 [Nitrososphaerales archaeon]|nr:hypothetical protein [Nitrososphaerales archaeon]
MTSDVQQSRIDILIRVIGAITFGFGALLVYYSAVNATTAGIAPEIITINASLGVLLAIVGFLAFFAKFK